MLCSRQTAVCELNGWISQGTLLGILFFDHASRTFLNFPAERIEVSDQAVVFHGPYNSAFSVRFPKSAEEGYFEFGVPNAIGQPEGYATYNSFAAALCAKDVTCLQVWTESGCLVIYEALAAMDAVPLVQ